VARTRAAGPATLPAVRRIRLSRRDLVSAAVTGPFVVWAVVRASGAGLGYPLVGAIAFTPQVAALSPVAIVVALVQRRRAVAVVAGAACVTLAVIVLPRSADGPQLASAGDPGTPLVVMTSNLLRGEADIGEVLRLARERHVDVLSLQELTPEAARRLDSAGARELFPARVLQPRTGAAGTGLLARHELRPVDVAAIDGHEQPEATLTLPGGRELRIKAVHPISPVSAARTREWREQLSRLGPPVADDGTPRVLAGDFNATLDHRELRDVLGHGFYDAADATGDGLHATWPVGRVSRLIALDHVLLPPQVKVRSVSVHDIRRSDHRALIAELLLSPPRR
jgi:endonuclease/exonuclease/phosphatase family metal-dependent hydrolase